VIRIYNKYKDSELAFITISVAQVPNPQYMRDVAQINKIPFPILLDPDWVVSGAYNTGIPVTFFIDRQGVIRQKLAGALSLAIFEQGIAEIMAK
jgi:alkyl hydroperoxide reductase subunit AhpC